MLELRISNNNEKAILTLTELVSLPAPYYLFVFTHVTTKEAVKFIKSPIDDESSYTTRYNQFNIDTATVFDGKTTGEWHYKVYEQESNTNTDTSLTGALLEAGKMYLYAENEFEHTKYNQAVSFKTYNG